MTHIVLLMTALTFSTGVEPIAGSSLSAQERDASPSGRHLGSLADLYFAEWVNLQTAGGGLSRFDPMYLSSHGHAWNQLQTSIYGLDLTDGVGPGFLVEFHSPGRGIIGPFGPSRSSVKCSDSGCEDAISV